MIMACKHGMQIRILSKLQGLKQFSRIGGALAGPEFIATVVGLLPGWNEVSVDLHFRPFGHSPDQ
jgi:hypothetical protein